MSPNTQDQYLNKARAFYFCFYAATAALIPYLVIYYRHLGMSGGQIGLLAAILPFFMLLSAPLWTALADSTHKHRLLLTISICSAVLLVLVLSQTRTLRGLIIVISLYAFTASPIISLVDNAVMQVLQDKKSYYGRQRLWGAIGWGISAPIIGFLIEKSGLGWLFWCYGPLMITGLFFTFGLPFKGRKLQKSFLTGVRHLLVNPWWLSFLFIVFVTGIAQATVGTFFILHLDNIGASKTLIGLSLTMATLSEIPIYYYADRLLKRWGARGLLIFSTIGYLVRVLAYSLVIVPWTALFLQLLHGTSYSALLVAGVSYADEIAPPGLGASAQGLFSAVLIGIGVTAGNLIGGTLYESFGAAVMYRSVGLVIFISLILFMLVERNFQKNITKSLAQCS
jgi:PPP family 3-phenylpropionic acid transporter